MKIDLESLPADGGEVRTSGEDPVSVLSWDYGPRDVVRPAGPMQYDLRVRLVGSELLVHGTAGARFRGTCCSCGGPLDRRYEAQIDCTRAVERGAGEEDLTSELRESILLALPSHPVCSDVCPGPAPEASSGSPSKARERAPDGGPWDALDSIFGGTTHDNQRPRNHKTPK